MSFYRKKPVVIEALQWDGSMDSYETIHARWPELEDSGLTSHKGNRTIQGWSVRTLEGRHIVSVGDYIIKGVNGEFYPCKPDIFKLTYEATACSITQITEQEQRLTNTLRMTTEALKQVTAERDALRDALEDALEVMENEGPVFWQEVQDKARAVLKGKS